MMYLFDHYGGDFLGALHREDANGIAGLDAVLDQYDSRKSGQDTIHDWAATVALDQAIDRRRGVLLGGQTRDFTSRSLSGVINWDSSQTYDSPGAPPNGSDYVRLRAAGGHYLTLSQLRSISFRGSPTLPPDPWSGRSTRRRRTRRPPRHDLRVGARGTGAGGAVQRVRREPRSLARFAASRSRQLAASLTFETLSRHRGGLGLRLRPGLDRRRSDLDFLGRPRTPRA